MSAIACKVIPLARMVAMRRWSSGRSATAGLPPDPARALGSRLRQALLLVLALERAHPRQGPCGDPPLLGARIEVDVDHHEPGAELVDPVDQGAHVRGRAAQPIQAGDHQAARLAHLEQLKRVVERGPVEVRAGVRPDVADQLVQGHAACLAGEGDAPRLVSPLRAHGLAAFREGGVANRAHRAGRGGLSMSRRANRGTPAAELHDEARREQRHRHDGHDQPALCTHAHSLLSSVAGNSLSLAHRAEWGSQIYGVGPGCFQPQGGYAEKMRMSLSAAGLPRSDALRLGRYLPLSVAVTVAVTVLPLLAVTRLGPTRTPMAVAVHVVVAAVLSMLVARLLAALWQRHERSSDLVFGDLLLWGWVRRELAERRLEAASRELAGPVASGDAHADLLRRMGALLEARDPYTHGHSRRVARHSERIARELGLPPEQVARIRAAALVHDIGKINVPRPILTKPGRLTEEEFALVKRHPGDGAAMVAALGDSELTAIVRSHHERIDGTGYPDGLAGADIPIGARIIAVADTFDAITSTRPYRDPRTHKQALDVLQGEAGTQLDARAVAAFASYYTARRSVGWVTVLVAAPQRLLSGLGGLSTGFGAGVAPLAQTACGVGGSRWSGPASADRWCPRPPSTTTRPAPPPATRWWPTPAPDRPKRRSGGSPTHRRSRHAHTKRGAHLNGGGATAAPGDRHGRPPFGRRPRAPRAAGAARTRAPVRAAPRAAEASTTSPTRRMRCRSPCPIRARWSKRSPASCRRSRRRCRSLRCCPRG